ncbi:MAG: cell wall hydrolase, partial [Candidatus Devosia euplotis]|nr:cell wall hydrolase [Candidatus Devosia euplotis]
MTKFWQLKAVRAFALVLTMCAAALVLPVTFAPVQAQSLQIASAAPPLPIPTDLVAIRAQPAIGPTLVPLAPGEQALTPTLLANYVQRQKTLRAVDVLGISEPQPLTSDVLMGYIARGTLGSNSAVSTLASFAAAPATPQPVLNTSELAAYVESGYQPTGKRIEQADAERNCLAQAIYHEARGESATGQLAVANVIVNRARSSKFPSTLCGVVYQNAEKGYHRCQFTFACDGRTDAPGERSAWNRSAA